MVGRAPDVELGEAVVYECVLEGAAQRQRVPQRADLLDGGSSPVRVEADGNVPMNAPLR